MTVKEAAQNLLNKNEITQEQFEAVSGIDFEKVAGIFASGGALSGTGGVLRDIINTVAVTGLAASLGSDIYSKIKQKTDQTSAYEGMLKKMPDLKEYPKDQVQDYYDVVKTFSPKSASNPLVAGALVNKMIQFGGVDHKLVQDLASIEGPAPSVLQDMTSSAAKSLAKFPTGGEDNE